MIRIKIFLILFIVQFNVFGQKTSSIDSNVVKTLKLLTTNQPIAISYYYQENLGVLRARERSRVFIVSKKDSTYGDSVISYPEVLLSEVYRNFKKIKNKELIVKTSSRKGKKPNEIEVYFYIYKELYHFKYFFYDLDDENDLKKHPELAIYIDCIMLLHND